MNLLLGFRGGLRFDLAAILAKCRVEGGSSNPSFLSCTTDFLSSPNIRNHLCLSLEDRQQNNNHLSRTKLYNLMACLTETPR